MRLMDELDSSEPERVQGLYSPTYAFLQQNDGIEKYAFYVRLFKTDFVSRRKEK